jgi:DNA polymerase III subunit epsilon
MRQVVLDTETTGISSDLGHRIIEIGCVELIDRKLTNNHFHTYLNPQREIDEGAFRVHGISLQFLQDKPLFQSIVSEFVEFIKGAELIIHNAIFDVGFINAELKRVNSTLQIKDLSTVFDTLILAKEKHPGQRNNLDALCKRYEIDNSNRTLHGALLDAEILASVYLAMTGGQANLFDDNIEHAGVSQIITTQTEALLMSASPILVANPQELEKHEEFIQFLLKKSESNLWSSE